MTRQASRGFTLIEVLIVVVVAGMLMLLLNQGVVFGVRAAATQLRQEMRGGDLDAVDRALRQMIAHTDPGRPPQRASLRGGAQSLTLVTDLPIGAEPQRVQAALSASGGALLLRWTPRRHVVAVGSPPAAQELTLLSGVAGLDLAYFNGAGWSPNWTAEKLPLLVRITLRFADPARRWPPIEAAPMREAMPQ